MYYSQSEFVEILEKAKDLAVRYKDSYESLLNAPGSVSVSKYRCTRTIHNLKETIRPDLMSANRDMLFFDNSLTWQTKKARTYTISRYADGKVKSISAGKDYTEFFIYENDDIILADYSLDKASGSFVLESVACGHYTDGKPVYFFVNELIGGYPEKDDLHFKLEEYAYQDDKLISITTRDLTASSEAAPEVFLDKLIYDEHGSLSIIERHCPNNDKVGVAVLKVTGENISF